MPSGVVLPLAKVRSTIWPVTVFSGSRILKPRIARPAPGMIGAVRETVNSSDKDIRDLSIFNIDYLIKSILILISSFAFIL